MPSTCLQWQTVILRRDFNKEWCGLYTLVYNDKQSSYEEILLKNGTVSIHYRNIQILATEMFKVKTELSPEIICDIFTQRMNNHYNLRNINHFETPFVRPIYNESERVLYLGPKIWDIVPE